MENQTIATMSEEQFGSLKNLICNKEYNQVLSILNNTCTNCILTHYLKALAYQGMAKEYEESFPFRFYKTPDMCSRLLSTLEIAYEHIYQCSLLMVNVEQHIQKLLNDTLWSKIFQIEAELARARPMPTDEDDDIFANDPEFEAMQTENVIDNFADWNLN